MSFWNKCMSKVAYTVLNRSVVLANVKLSFANRKKPTTARASLNLGSFASTAFITRFTPDSMSFWCC